MKNNNLNAGRNLGDSNKGLWAVARGETRFRNWLAKRNQQRCRKIKTIQYTPDDLKKFPEFTQN